MKEAGLILNIYKKNKRYIIIISVLLVILAACNAFLPILSSNIIDDGLLKNNTQLVILYAVGIMLVHIIMGVLNVIIESNRVNGFNAVQTDLRQQSYKKITRIKQSYYARHSSTEIYQQLDEDIHAISNCFSAGVLLAVVQIFLTVGLVPVLFKISYKLTLLVIAAIPVVLLKTLLAAKKRIQAFI